MNMNKIIKIISLLFCVFSLISMKAQNDSRVAQIPEIVDLYEQLENMFPYSDYVNLTQTEVSYWVNNLSLIHISSLSAISQRLAEQRCVNG